ncbi:MAG: SDR family NAD(P)-dependent oxidoreductase [Ilumatobacter sp.]|jgi:NAD(P)-dependent dehydrogenase (short-subunit alcohol dehydrogenase family)|nr:SDR family NAD(P)-dependent oxidoreductase [Ilumatobacter sp.]MDG1695576.1 SDR family NAD(P)-dependent oxidoreductase [Ilumatobacter sp.]MDG2439515.1 SDR family NAD(P)-dependent oxidoreductase [Ilumatobacter sp.]
MDDFSGKTAVITGAASGIGLELAKQFGAAGMNLMLADVERPALDRAEAELREAGYPVSAREIDVRDHDQIIDLDHAARDRFGNVHVLCNNAGVGAGGPVADPDNLEAWRWTIDINLWGVIYGCKVFLPGMIEHGEQCHIVNTASMAGLGSAPMMGPYNISKYGVVALSETLSKEMQIMQTAVGVSVLCPAFVATGIANSDRNMPDDVRATLPKRAASSGMQAQIEAMVAGGINTEVVGQHVLDAVRNDRFWILTHDESKASVTARADDIVNSVNPSMRAGFA